MTSLYVYALTDDKIAPLHVAGRRLDIIPIAGIHAIVEALSERPDLSEEALQQQHEIVMKVARRSNAILPVRFGSFVTRKELEAVLSRRCAELRRAFDMVRQREQMTIRVIGEPQMPAPPALGAATRPAPSFEGSNGSGTRYLQARRAATAGRPLPPVVQDLISAVRPWVKAERVEAGGEPVRTTVYHLIERGRSAEYRRAIERVVDTPQARPGRAAKRRFEGLVIRVTGPWPPFAFAPELWP